MPSLSFSEYPDDYFSERIKTSFMHCWRAQKMSLNERIHKSNTAPSMGVIARSKSFAGFLNNPRSRSSCPHTPVLGQDWRSPGMQRRSTISASVRGLSKSLKLPKCPRPGRTQIIFESIKKGLNECIYLTQEDINSLKVSTESMSVQSTQEGNNPYKPQYSPNINSYGRKSATEWKQCLLQLKAAERYLKRLEFHLAKIEELQDNYHLQLKLREGVRNMAQAYGKLPTPGRNREMALNNVKYGYKECTQNMCAIEAQLEYMMGTLDFQMKGVVGFARLCAGDVFEITIKYGGQKWKSRGRIDKGKKQSWEAEHHTFKSLLGEVLNIKAVEMKGLGKSVLLGNKHCETKDLFAAHPHIMTVNLNPNGSLKLNLIITWNPLDGCSEEITWSQISTKAGSSFNKRKNMSNGSCSQLPSPSSEFSGGEDSSESHFNCKQIPSPISSSPTSTPSGTSTSSLKTEHNTLERVLQSISAALEDIQGQYPELQELEQQIVNLEEMLLKGNPSRRSSRSSRSSSISISVESALECFDFLDTEIEVDDDCRNGSRSPSRENSVDRAIMHPELTTKTMDSGIESLAHRLSDDGAFSNSLGSSPIPTSTGNDQVDQALLQHLNYCDRLIENLGSFGPLKCKELYALDKLSKQAGILASLIKLSKAGPQVKDIHEVLYDISPARKLHELWEQYTAPNSICMQAESLLRHMEAKLFANLKTKSTDLKTKVFQLLIMRILDQGKYEPDMIVTVYQFLHYFKQGNIRDLERHLEELETEVVINDSLKSGIPDSIIKTISKMKKTLPPEDCLRTLSSLLITGRGDVKNAAVTYLKSLNSDRNLKEKALDIFVEALENKNSEIRQGACAAIGVFKATECIDALVYLHQSDENLDVKLVARETLLTLGDEGRRAFETTQLSTHGFQGLGSK